MVAEDKQIYKHAYKHTYVHTHFSENNFKKPGAPG